MQFCDQASWICANEIMRSSKASSFTWIMEVIVKEEDIAMKLIFDQRNEKSAMSLSQAVKVFNNLCRAFCRSRFHKHALL